MSIPKQQLPVILEQLMDFYQNLDSSNIAQLSNIYHPQIEFRDPLHQIHGIDGLEKYFRHLMENVLQLSFEFQDCEVISKQAFLSWTMQFSHPRFNQGNAVSVQGISKIEFNEKIIKHRDYFDVGEMFYEHMPVIGGLNRWLKRKI